jgi:hypothetical protein
MWSWQMAIALVALSGLLFVAPGCASEQHSYDYDYDDSLSSFERPAVPIEEEETFADKLGEIGVVCLAVGGVVAGAVLPFLLF